MSLSRTIHVFKQGNNAILKRNTMALIKQQSRNSGDAIWFYRRNGNHLDTHFNRAADVYSAIAWWWFLWHCFHDYEHIIGEWDVPNPRNWTDEELGIPPE